MLTESLGHAVGDDLLAAAAPRLKQMLRASDTIARFGADGFSFGILLKDIIGEQDAVEMAQRIAGAFNRPFVLDGNEHFVSVSIGISLAAGGERAEDLVRDADAAVRHGQSEELFGTLAELKSLGVSLILDDFGTGYSSPS